MLKIDYLNLIDSMGIELKEGENYTNNELFLLIMHHQITLHKELDTFLMWYYLNLKNLMLCKRFDSLKQDEREYILSDNNEYIAEPKIRGVRCLISYHPQDGLEFLGRDTDDSSCIPFNYKKNILLIQGGNVHYTSYKSDDIPTFILDCEIQIKNKSDQLIFSHEEFCQLETLLKQSPEEAHQRQLKGERLCFYIIDMLYYGNKDIKGIPLFERKKYIHEFVNSYSNYLPFLEIPYKYDEKLKLFNNIVDNGGEGIILRDINSPYRFDGRRKKDLVKYKDYMSEENKIFFIAGLTRLKNCATIYDIGLKLSTPDKDHEYGVCFKIPEAVREHIFMYDEFGEISGVDKNFLNTKVLGREVKTLKNGLKLIKVVKWQ